MCVPHYLTQIYIRLHTAPQLLHTVAVRELLGLELTSQHSRHLGLVVEYAET